MPLTTIFSWEIFEQLKNENNVKNRPKKIKTYIIFCIRENQGTLWQRPKTVMVNTLLHLIYIFGQFLLRLQICQEFISSQKGTKIYKNKHASKNE